MESFSIKRIALLMQKNIYENTKGFLKGLSILFGAFMVIILFTMYDNFSALKTMNFFYNAGFIVTGILVAGMAFSNLRSKEKTMSYLSLPASTIEKLLAELLISTVVFFAVYVSAFYIFNFLMILFGQVVNVEVELVNIFREEVLMKYWYFIIFQSIAFAGAATFRKRPLLSTGFSLFVAGNAIILYLLIFAMILKNTGQPTSIAVDSLGIHDIDTNSDVSDLFPYSMFIVNTAKNLFYYATAPVFWTVAYFKLKEKEV